MICSCFICFFPVKKKAITTPRAKGPTCFQRSRQETDSCWLWATWWGGGRLSVQLAYIYKIDNLQILFFFKCMVLFELFYYSIYYSFILQCRQVNRAIKTLTLLHLVLKFKGFRILLASILAFNTDCLIFHSFVNFTECETVLLSSLPWRYQE